MADIKNLIPIVKSQAKQFNLDWAAVISFIEVETGGRGFDEKTGKIIIQFEPSWFKKKAPYAPSGLWSVNKVDVQSREWEAFNDAFQKDSDAAMQSASIGLGQIMGFHYERLGYNNVGEMWNDAKKGIDRQIWQILQFIETDKRLKTAIKIHAWSMATDIYNGLGSRELAIKNGWIPYEEKLKTAYVKYSAMA